MNEPTQALELVTDKPQELMRRATDVAGVCKEIVLKTAVQIQGRKYVKCEGWMSIATAHGCIASSRDVEKVEGGWKAIGEIKRIHDGAILSTAEGFVGMDETKTWAVRPEYACRAMAQTRAISRACRAAFAHVVVLMDAGLSTTPAEEVPDEGFEGLKQARTAPPATFTRPAPKNAPTVTQTPSRATQTPPKEATSVTRAAMMEWLMENGVSEQDIVGYGIDKAIIMPNEGLADWPLDKVGTSKAAWALILGEIKQYLDGDLATPPTAEEQPPAENREVGLIQQIAEKPGKNKKGKPYVKIGVKVNDAWHNSFDTDILAVCKEAKEMEVPVDIEFKTTEYGREILSCVAVPGEVTP